LSSWSFKVNFKVFAGGMSCYNRFACGDFFHGKSPQITDAQDWYDVA